MSELVVRAAVVAALAGVAFGVARLVSRWQRPIHAAPSLDGLGIPAGLVVFTSTDCANCRAALAVAADTEAPVREVTHELEPMLFEAAGVEGLKSARVAPAASAVGSHASRHHLRDSA